MKQNWATNDGHLKDYVLIIWEIIQVPRDAVDNGGTDPCQSMRCADEETVYANGKGDYAA